MQDTNNWVGLASVSGAGCLSSGAVEVEQLFQHFDDLLDARLIVRLQRVLLELCLQTLLLAFRASFILRHWTRKSSITRRLRKSDSYRLTRSFRGVSPSAETRGRVLACLKLNPEAKPRGPASTQARVGARGYSPCQSAHHTQAHDAHLTNDERCPPHARRLGFQLDPCGHGGGSRYRSIQRSGCQPPRWITTTAGRNNRCGQQSETRKPRACFAKYQTHFGSAVSV